MFKSALNYLSGAASDSGAGQSEAGGGAADSVGGAADPIVGSRVDVGGVEVRVRRRIGEGGFAFVYAVEGDDGRKMALKRLLAVDQVTEGAFTLGKKKLAQHLSPLCRCSGRFFDWSPFFQLSEYVPYKRRGAVEA